MYPGPRDPDLGVFVRQMELALRERGHEIDLAVLDTRSGGKRRYAELARRVHAAPKPDVVYAHFLVPSGLIALKADAPLVVTAHGRDVRNIGSILGISPLTAIVVRRAAAVIAVSDYLRRELECKLPVARGKTSVIDSGVDLERFSPSVATEHRLESPAFLCVGSLTRRKNVVRLADAFARIGEGSLTFVGDGPLRAQLEGEGHSVLEAANGAVAIQRATAESPNFVLLDLYLPDMNGLEVARTLRKTPVTRHIPIAGWTVDCRATMYREALAAGYIDFCLDKPVSVAVIEALVEKHAKQQC